MHALTVKSEVHCSGSDVMSKEHNVVHQVSEGQGSLHLSKVVFRRIYQLLLSDQIFYDLMQYWDPRGICK